MTKKNNINKEEQELINQTEEQMAEEVQEEQEVMTPEEQLQQERDQYLAGWQRAQADYQNLKRSVEQEKQDLIKYRYFYNNLCFLFENPFHQLLNRANYLCLSQLIEAC